MSDTSQYAKDAEAIVAKLRKKGEWVLPFDEFDPPRQWVADYDAGKAADLIEDLTKLVDMLQGELDNRMSMYESLLAGQLQTEERVRFLEETFAIIQPTVTGNIAPKLVADLLAERWSK